MSSGRVCGGVRGRVPGRASVEDLGFGLVMWRWSLLVHDRG